MPPSKKDAAYLLDMLEAAKKVQRYVKDKTFEDFQKNDLLCDAVERNIEIIGEAARRVSEAFKQEHPDIVWRKIIAQRNVLIHEYSDIGIEEIYEVATIHIPLLANKIKLLIPPLPNEIE